ncbi:protein tyrosine phosphatase activity [Sparganum proliferum]
MLIPTTKKAVPAQSKQTVLGYILLDAKQPSVNALVSWVRGLSATAVEVSWAPPSKESRNGRIIGYQVHYYRFGSTQTTSGYQNTTQSRLRIDGLQEQTVYTFRVRAFTSSGPGPWSASNTIRTTAELPNPPPQIQAVRINQRQIKVTWSLPQRTDAQPGTADYRPVPVTGFRIYYSKYDNIGDQEAWDILEVGAVTMATLDGLMPSESYVIRIKSRGTDKRYGNWSSPVIVPADRYGLDQRGNFMGRVQDLRCVSTKSEIYGQASLRIMWMPPPDKRLLKEYQIRVTGIKSFINELNERNRVFIGPRTHIVAVPRDGSDGDVSSVSVARSDFLNSADVPMEHSIDSLEPNGIFDVELRAVYEVLGNRPAADTEAPWEKTSCRTKMHPPVNISAPVPVSYNSNTNEVLMRTFRVSERLGPIRRYFLIVTRLERSRSISNLEKIDWHAELRRLNANKEAETRVAAEFTQMAFRSPQLEIPVGGRENAKRRRRRSAAVPRKRAKLLPQSDSAVAAAPRLEDAKMPSEVLLYDCSLKKGHQYKALLLACIHPDVQHSIVLPKRTNLGYADTYGISDSVWATTPETFGEEGQTTEYEDEDSLSSTYCAASPWSVAFQPNKSLLFTDPLGVGGRVASGGFGIGGNRIGPSFFTVILVTVIVSLGLVALICIAVQCFFRRRPKQQHGAIGGKLTSADGSLKTPLMPPPSHTSLLPGIDPVELQSSDFHNKAASPVPGMLNSSRVNSPVPRSVKSVDNMPLPGQPPISLDHLAVHVTNLKSFDNNGLYKEYEAIDPGSGYTWQNANLDLNKPKNRYANVIAYDHSRVLLRQLPGIPCSDYINANYIDGYQRQNAYIATQGPLPETFADFWRMVWEQNSRIIVMMTRLEERARLKCDQYWPSRGTEHFCITPEPPPPGAPKLDYTALSVTILENTEYAYYTVRTFAVQKLLAEESATLPPTGGTSEGPYEGLRPVSGTRHVKQFQFTAWPDCGAPEQAQPLLFFMRQVNQARGALLQQHQSQLEANGGAPGMQQNAASTMAPASAAATTAAANRLGPVIVHCSAGVGRTGAFIAIDSQLERMKHENSVDIFGTVSRMRTQRNFMVQTEQQYAFLYEVLVEAARVSGSEVTVHGLYNYVMKLRQPAPTALLSQYFGEMGNGGVKVNYGGPPQTAASVTSMDIEFQRVPLNLQISSQCTSASLPENMTKNRTSQVLPYESNRVVLSQLRDLEGADYINASFVDGYWSRQAYIATQAPLANTVKDFWRMVWEHNSPIIVMLSQLSEAGRQLCYQYWPAEHSERYQNFLVEPMVEYNMPSFVLREFRMTDTHDGQSRTLRQFQFSDWRETSSPSRTAEALIELIAQVHKTQAQFGQDGPITVHCSTGAGRTGVFIALSILLERMRCEGVVDLLLTTRLLRTQRNNMIENVDQYAFCYAALLEYLASFEH